MEWEEHLREMAQTAVEHPGYKMLAWLTAKDAVAEIDRLRAEIARLTAEIERLDKVFHNQGNLREQIFDLQFEITRLNDLIGNTRLADRESIERHTAKRVAGEILLIMDGSETYEDAVSEIRNQYGVE